MSSDSSPLVIHHHAAASRFEAEIQGQLAFAAYVREGNRITFTHTEVPPPLRGGGIAAQLVRRALDFARAEKLRVVPQCSYVDAYIRRYPEFQELVETFN